MAADRPHDVRVTAVTFVARDGAEHTVEAAPGDRLLDIAQASGQPLEGTCEGQMACSTCHVWVDKAAALPPPSGEEEDLLDLTPHVRRDSRLACQIRVGEKPLTVRMPGSRR